MYGAAVGDDTTSTAHLAAQQECVRKIYLGESSNEQAESERQQFKSNYVSTTKYEIWNIVPKNLLEQFQRVANLWFLTVSIFQMLPLELSPTSQYATILPLCCVIFVTFCKDAWEDQLRRRDDWRVNNQPCKVVETSQDPQLRTVRWKEVVVGSYVKLERDAPVPADMILLSSSNEDGVGFVDTAQLDGETSLKPKFALEETMGLSEVHDLCQLQGHIDTEMPNELVQSFSGTLFLRGHPRGVPVDAKNFLLRGSTLRNTAWIFGLTVFTGVDTKLVQNSKPTPSKRSHVEVLANRLLLIVFGVLAVTALASAIARAIWISSGETGELQMDWVWPERDPLQDNKYLAFITFLIGYNNLIPISLYVTTDLVRTFQGMLMEWDPSMYHDTTDSFCRVRNSGLCENLGQVEFVLSDKTGTLTENKMSFKACCIGLRVYGRWDPNTGPTEHVVRMPPSDICVPLDPSLWTASRAMRRSTRTDSERVEIDDFFVCLATCHTAIIEELPAPLLAERMSGNVLVEALQAAAASVKGEGGRRGSGTGRRNSNSANKAQFLSGDSTASARSNCDPDLPSAELIEEASGVTFRSSSPDEEALIAAARDHGYFFRKKVASRLVVNVRGKDLNYNVLICNEFTSDRKRMSVLVQRADAQEDEEDPPPATLYVKGADNVMLERLNGGGGEKGTVSCVKAQIKRFSSCGLRTLVLAKREVSAAQAESFVQKTLEAKGALMYRDRMMEEVADEMERQLEYLGITAIEDQIQQGVPETINMLLRAGIKVWMLTGDNMETAINIGTACRLTTSEMTRYMLDAANTAEEALPENVEKKLEGFYKDISRRLNKVQSGVPFQYSVVVHGSILYTIEDHDRLRQLFLSIACSSSSVIACRLAPAQKAALVHLVRRGLEGNPLTLAIGDGGNDVSMIQEAHVGVGLLGVEGRQAANASDFIIGQFRFLQTLLLVHGRWNLRRIGIVIGYSFYKNFALVLPMVYYAFYTGFTGTTLYDSYLLTIYNMFFTSLPIMIMGVFDCDVSAKLALHVPSLYQMGISGTYFNRWMLIGWIARGTFHSLLIFLGMRLIFTGSMATPGGVVPDYLVMGSWGYWACVVVVNVIMLLHTKAWMDWYLFIVAGSAMLFLPMLTLYSQGDYATMLNGEMAGVGTILFGRPGSWAGLVLVVTACGLSDLAILFARKVASPDAADILQEVQLGHLNGVDRAGLAVGCDKVNDDGNARDAPEESLTGKASASGSDSEGGIMHSDSLASFGVDADSPKLRDPARGPNAHEAIPVADEFSEAKEVLTRLPCPPPRMHQVKPIDNLYLEPLVANSDRTRGQSKWSRRMRVKAAVAPEPEQPGFNIVMPSAARSSAASWDNTTAPTFSQRDRGCADRLWRVATGVYEKAWWSQWCEMTVGDLLLSVGSPECSRIPVTAQKPIQSGGGNSIGPSSLASATDASEIGTRRLESPLSPVASASRDEAVQDSAPMNSGSMTSMTSTLATSCEASKIVPLSIETTGVGVAGKRNSLHNENALTMSIGSSDTYSKEVVKDLIYSVVTLRFFASTQETSFRKYFSAAAIALARKSLFGAAAAIALYNMYLVVAYSEQRTVTRALYCAGIPAACAAAWMFFRTGVVVRNAEQVIAALTVLLVFLKHVYDFVLNSDGILGNSYMPLFIMAGARIRISGICLVLLFHSAALLIHYWFAADHLKANDRLRGITDNGQLQAEYFVLMLSITALSVYHAYGIEYLMRQDFIMLCSLKTSKHEAMEILKSMFPEEVVNHVVCKEQDVVSRQSRNVEIRDQQNIKSIREDCGIVTVLFCDIHDFDALIENLDPKELVRLLDSVWVKFDGLVQHGGLTKIETVGKTYMAAAMTEGQQETKIDKGVTNALLTAIAMLELVEKRVLGVGKITNVSVRIGIHTGQAFCGVVGSRKPQFALFGDTVNTASRMQSTSQKNHIHVSSNTHKRLQDDERFMWTAKKTQVKGKGEMDTYLLSSSSRSSKTRLTGRQNASRAGHGHLGDQGAGAGRPQIAIDEDAGSHAEKAESRSCSHATTSTILTSRPSPMNRFSGDRAERKGGDGTSTPRSEKSHESKEAIVTFGETDTDAAPQAAVSTASPPLTRMNSTTTNSTTTAKGGFGSHQALRSGKKFLRAIQGQVQDQTQRDMIMNNQDIKSIWVFFQYFWVCYAAESFCLLLGRQGSSNSSKPMLILMVRLGYLALALAGSVWLRSIGRRLQWKLRPSRSSNFFSDIVACLIFGGFVSSTVSNVCFLRDGSEFWNAFEAFFFIMMLTNIYRMNLQGRVPVILCLLVIVATVVITGFQGDTSLMWECIVYSLLMSGTQMLAVQGDPRRFRYEHKAICEEHDRVNQLLDSMLPQEVLAEMKLGNLKTAYTYDDMSFLFADIVGFTSYCASHSAEAAVNLVTRLFAEFDECTVQLQIYKVCTIGDAYVVVNEPRTKQVDGEQQKKQVDKFIDCERVFRLAEKMIQIIIRVRSQVDHEGLDMRIGLHSGSFVGGVIGTTRVRFDIWGQDVIIGNSVESEGIAGKICASEQAKEVLEKCPIGSALQFAFHKDFVTKNKQSVRTYVVSALPKTGSEAP